MCGFNGGWLPKEAALDKKAEKCYTVSLDDKEMQYMMDLCRYAAQHGAEKPQKLLDKLLEIVYN